jgi:hypothetical protein
MTGLTNRGMAGLLRDYDYDVTPAWVGSVLDLPRLIVDVNGRVGPRTLGLFLPLVAAHSKIRRRGMGWKTQTVLIRPATLDAGPDKLLADLGYDRNRKIDETSFSHAGPGSIWIGSIGDCIVMSALLSWVFLSKTKQVIKSPWTLKMHCFDTF